MREFDGCVVIWFVGDVGRENHVYLVRNRNDQDHRAWAGIPLDLNTDPHAHDKLMAYSTEHVKAIHGGLAARCKEWPYYHSQVRPAIIAPAYMLHHLLQPNPTTEYNRLKYVLQVGFREQNILRVRRE